jgi:hypothetical protein
MRPSDGAARGLARHRLAQHPCAVVVGLGVQACSTGEVSAPSVDPISNEPRPDGGAASMGSDGSGPAAATDAGAPDAPESYLAAESVIRSSCAFIRCHGGAVRGGAGLWFGQSQSIRGPLVNVPACEYDKMMRVKPGDLANSWMLIKLTAPRDPQTHAISFSPRPDWVPNPGCGLDPSDGGGRFGLGMPQTGIFELDPDSLAKLVAWIEAGAPGPD